MRCHSPTQVSRIITNYSINYFYLRGLSHGNCATAIFCRVAFQGAIGDIKTRSLLIDSPTARVGSVARDLRINQGQIFRGEDSTTIIRGRTAS